MVGGPVRVGQHVQPKLAGGVVRSPPTGGRAEVPWPGRGAGL